MFNLKRNRSTSFPAKPTAALATAMDCGEIILPVIPPEELAAIANTGSIPTEIALIICKFPNSKFADVSSVQAPHNVDA
jgi:hypothetical protein